MIPINRRIFIRKSVAVAGLMATAPSVIKGFVKNSPNDTINVAISHPNVMEIIRLIIPAIPSVI